jgi:hypothetical protein
MVLTGGAGGDMTGAPHPRSPRDAAAIVPAVVPRNRRRLGDAAKIDEAVRFCMIDPPIKSRAMARILLLARA